MIKKERMKVLNHKELAPSIFELTLQGELVSEMNATRPVCPSQDNRRH